MDTVCMMKNNSWMIIIFPNAYRSCRELYFVIFLLSQYFLIYTRRALLA